MKSKKLLSLVLSFAFLISLSGAAFAAFTDVTSNQYENEIGYCQTKDYVTGVSATTFSPDANLTRGQFPVIWCRFMNFRTGHPFTDIASLTQGKYYDSASFILYSMGAANGTSPTTFSPESIITREQLAVITARAEKLATSDTNAYKIYSDFDMISSWATEAVSACIKNNVFRGLYTNETFEPNKAVTRAEICKVLYNIDQPMHTITVGTLTGGTITVSQATAHAGDTITLTITPDTDKQLKDGTLKYNDNVITGTTFTMPTTDVLITAEFEDVAAIPSPSESPSPSPSESPSPSPSPSESPIPSPSESPIPSPSESPG